MTIMSKPKRTTKFPQIIIDKACAIYCSGQYTKNQDVAKATNEFFQDTFGENNHTKKYEVKTTTINSWVRKFNWLEQKDKESQKRKEDLVGQIRQLFKDKGLDLPQVADTIKKMIDSDNYNAQDKGIGRYIEMTGYKAPIQSRTSLEDGQGNNITTVVMLPQTKFDPPK